MLSGVCEIFKRDPFDAESTPVPEGIKVSMSGVVGDTRCRATPAASPGLVRSEVFSMSNPIKIQVLLRREWQTPDGIEKARNCLVQAGLRPTVAGLATISAELDQDHFQFLFGTSATDLPPRPSAAGDFGRSG